MMKNANVFFAASFVFLVVMSGSVAASLAGEGGTPAGPIMNYGAPMNTVNGSTPAGPLLNSNGQPLYPDNAKRNMRGNTPINGGYVNNPNTITQTTIGPYIEEDDDQ